MNKYKIGHQHFSEVLILIVLVIQYSVEDGWIVICTLFTQGDECYSVKLSLEQSTPLIHSTWLSLYLLTLAMVA